MSLKPRCEILFSHFLTHAVIFCYMGAQIKLAQDVERGKLDDPNDDYTRAAIQEKLRLFSREE